MAQDQMTMLDRINWFVEHLKSKEDKKIIIWGASENGKRVFQFCQSISVKIAYFVDKRCVDREEIAGGGGVLLPPSCIKAEKKEDVFILVASDVYYNEIRSNLLEWGFKDRIHFINALGYLGQGNKFFEYDFSARKEIRDNYGDKVDIFQTIEIETVNRCNNDCSFCPVNATSDTREFKMMTDELFYRILGQLKDMDYKGPFSFFSNNEPFLDKRITTFLKEAKTALPEALLYLYTNGTLLTMDKFLEAIKYLDLFVIDNYDDGYELIPSIKAIYEYCRDNPEMEKKVRISKVKKSMVRTTRGGQAPNREKIRVEGITCLIPFQQMVVRPDGRVSLCCADTFGKYTLGDLNHESILDVWYGKRYADIREKILEGRENLDLCSGCDMLIRSEGVYKAILRDGQLISVAQQ